MGNRTSSALILGAVVVAVLGVTAFAATRESSVTVRAADRPTRPTLSTLPVTLPTMPTTITTTVAVPTTVPATTPTTLATTSTSTSTTAATVGSRGTPFNPLAYDLVARLVQESNSGMTGWAGAKRVSPTEWQITVTVQHAKPGTDYDVIVVPDHPADPGTPGPTPCTFVGSSDGTGGCTGPLPVAPDGKPTNTSVLAGPWQAWGTFAPPT